MNTQTVHPERQLTETNNHQRAMQGERMIQTALQLSGLLLMGGAILLWIAIGMVSLNPVMNQTFSPRLSLLFLLASMFLLLSLPGMYARQAVSAGWLGLVGHGLFEAGILLLVLISATPILYPSVREPMSNNPVLFVLGIALTAGLLLTGISTVRAGVYPRGAGILLAVAFAGFFFDFFVAEFLPAVAMQVGSAAFGLLLALALAWIGYINLTNPAL